jgi:hypothetical protein
MLLDACTILAVTSCKDGSNTFGADCLPLLVDDAKPSANHCRCLLMWMDLLFGLVVLLREKAGSNLPLDRC